MTLNKFGSFEMWIYGRVLRISWMDKITNIGVMNRTGKKKDIIKKEWRLQHLRHIMHGERYRVLIIQGIIFGRRSIGRKRLYCDKVTNFSVI